MTKNVKTLRELIEVYNKNANIPPSSKKTYSKPLALLIQHCGDLPYTEITFTYLKKLKAEISPDMAEKYFINPVKAVFNWSHYTGLITFNQLDERPKMLQPRTRTGQFLAKNQISTDERPNGKVKTSPVDLNEIAIATYRNAVNVQTVGNIRIISYPIQKNPPVH